MLRKFVAAAAVAVGLFAAPGMAMAAPGDPTTYPPPPAETTSSGPPIVIVTPTTTATSTPGTSTTGSSSTAGGSTTTSSSTARNSTTTSTSQTFVTITVSVSGGGMLPGEQVSISVIYSGPSGLRADRALRAATLKAAGTVVTADANGNFSAGVAIDKGRTGTIVATGLTSGNTVSFAISADGSVSGGGSGGGGSGVDGGNGQTTDQGTAGGATTTVAYGEDQSTSSIAAAPVDEANSGGLASTGASIAGPLTVGVGALVAGLALLFFGTRLAIRRRGPAAQR